MEKLGFFGGCFNPVTKAHIDLIRDVIKKENLSKVYFVPMGDFYCKNNLIPVNHRIAMLKLAIKNEKKMDILHISNKDSKTRAIDSFKLIEEKFKNSEHFFIMGSDNYKKLPNWENSEKLINNYKYIVLDRDKGITKDISSSIAREKIRMNESANDLISEQVLQYIKINNLYK